MDAVFCLQRVLICGWGSSSFMLDLLKALDEELPKGSEVTLFNLRVTSEVVSKASLYGKDSMLAGVQNDCFVLVSPYECHGTSKASLAKVNWCVA